MRWILILGASAALSACAMETVTSDLFAPEYREFQEQAPPGARPGACWGKTVRPGEVAPVRHTILVQPAEVRSDGTVVSPPVYRTEVQDQVIKPTREQWFETPCPPVFTEDFIASLQRALEARDLYAGPISGRMDGRTKTAIRRYQRTEGLDSAILSTAAAKKLGLVVLTEPAL